MKQTVFNLQCEVKRLESELRILQRDKAILLDCLKARRRDYREFNEIDPLFRTAWDLHWAREDAAQLLFGREMEQ